MVLVSRTECYGRLFLYGIGVFFPNFPKQLNGLALAIAFLSCWKGWQLRGLAGDLKHCSERYASPINSSFWSVLFLADLRSLVAARIRKMFMCLDLSCSGCQQPRLLDGVYQVPIILLMSMVATLLSEHYFYFPFVLLFR